MICIVFKFRRMRIAVVLAELFLSLHSLGFLLVILLFDGSIFRILIKYGGNILLNIFFIGWVDEVEILLECVG